jgi:hypothetical protein
MVAFPAEISFDRITQIDQLFCRWGKIWNCQICYNLMASKSIGQVWSCGHFACMACLPGLNQFHNICFVCKTPSLTFSPPQLKESLMKGNFVSKIIIFIGNNLPFGNGFLKGSCANPPLDWDSSNHSHLIEEVAIEGIMRCRDYGCLQFFSKEIAFYMKTHKVTDPDWLKHFHQFDSD